MKSSKSISIIWGIDLHNIWRDDLLSWIITMPIGISLLLRWGLPYILKALSGYTNTNIIDYYTILAGFFILLITPMVFGMIVGFLLLEQRDNHTLTVLKITPISPLTYLLYSLLMPVIMSFIITVISFYLSGLGEIGIGIILISALLAAPLAPISALTLARFAENKVQGFALIKATIVFWIPPIIAYFLRPDWHSLFGVIPLYWLSIYILLKLLK